MLRKAFMLVATAALVLAGCAETPPPNLSQATPEPLMVVGRPSVLEFGPVLLAAGNAPAGTVVTGSGGVANLWDDAPDSELSPGIADLAGNSSTQMLGVSLAHPDARIIMTVTEGLYRIVARPSSGITSLQDLKGKRIATFANTSAAVYLHEALATVGLNEADVTIVSLTEGRDPNDVAQASAEALINGEVDALAIWEPEAERAAQALGDDVVVFQPEGIYREVYNLNAKAGDLADPAKRAQIVAFLREVTVGCAKADEDPDDMQAMLAEGTGQDLELIRDSWHHHRFPCALPADLLDILVEEERWLAQIKTRAPRGREELANLIDASVLEEVLAQ